MDITNFSKDRTVKYLSLGVFAIAALMLLQKLFLSGGQVVIQSLPPVLPNITLKASDIEKIISLGGAQSQGTSTAFEPMDLPANVGRDNPFIPYPLVEPVVPTTTLATITPATTSPATTTISESAQ